MAFDISNFLNAESKKEIKNDWKTVKINANKLVPSSEEENFYGIDEEEVKQLAATIELVGLQQPLVVREIPETDKYEVLVGNKRLHAIMLLLAEGKTEYEMVPCKISIADSVIDKLILIFTNSTQRGKVSDYVKMKEIEEIRRLLKELEATQRITGKKQNIIADILGINKTKVGTLDNINNNLIDPFVDEYAEGKINTSTANKLAGMAEEEQKQLYEDYKQNGEVITVQEIKNKQEKQKMEEQPSEEPIKEQSLDEPIEENTEPQEQPNEPLKEAEVNCTQEEEKQQETPQNDLQVQETRDTTVEIANNQTEKETTALHNLIECDDCGNWSVKGLPWKNLYEGQIITRNTYEKLYGCLCKLMWYEETGLPPEQVEEVSSRNTPTLILPKLCWECEKDDCSGCNHECNRCPSCKDSLDTDIGEQYKFCPNCGQRLEWN